MKVFKSALFPNRNGPYDYCRYYNRRILVLSIESSDADAIKNIHSVRIDSMLDVRYKFCYIFI